MDFLERATADAENRTVTSNHALCAAAYRRHKWRCVGKLAQTTDKRWSKRLLNRKPHFHCQPSRSFGYPKLRREDGFTKIADGDWPAIAATEVWPALEQGFVSHVF